jgi:hypothetical protein
MPRKQQPEQNFPVKLTQAQRKVVAEVVPELADRLKLDCLRCDHDCRLSRLRLLHAGYSLPLSSLNEREGPFP